MQTNELPQPQPTLAVPDADPDSRRREMRFCFEKNEQVLIWAPQSGHVSDESYSGVGVLLDGPTDVRLGQEVRVSYRDTDEPALVRSMKLDDDGRWRLGLQWKRPGGPYAPQGDTH